MTLAEIERRAILVAVKKMRGNAVLAAKKLGIGKTTIYRKLKQYQASKKRRKRR